MSDASTETRIVRPVMPELDTIRGIAILLVFWFHGFRFFEPAAAAPAWERLFIVAARQGGAGVNLFFVLSGFLITGILLDSAARPDYYSRFYLRRALRILPAYYLLLLVLFAMRYVSFAPRHASLGFLTLCFFYLSNMTPLFGVPMQYGPLWSLAVEEHFYLIWPAAVRAMSKGAFVILAAAICVLEPFLRMYAVHLGGRWWWTYTWLFADGLALGALLAVFARSSLSSRKNLLRISFASAVVAAAALFISFTTPHAVAVGARFTGINWLSLTAVSAILWVGTGPYRRLVNFRVLAFYGYISYGLYLYHALAFDIYDQVATRLAPSLRVGASFAMCCVRFLAALALATAVAYVSRTTFEEFFLRMKNRSRTARDRASAVAAA